MRRYGPEDLALAQQLADRCALALDNARLFEELSEAAAAAERAGEEVNTILGGVADAVTAQAPDGTLVYANDAAVRIVGFGTVAELLIVRSRMAGTREWRWARVKSTPVFTQDGAVRLAINVIEDITELKYVEQGQRFLAEAGRVLADSLDYEETLAAVARLAVPGVADWCAVDVVAGTDL